MPVLVSQTRIDKSHLRERRIRIHTVSLILLTQPEHVVVSSRIWYRLRLKYVIRTNVVMLLVKCARAHRRLSPTYHHRTISHMLDAEALAEPRAYLLVERLLGRSLPPIFHEIPPVIPPDFPDFLLVTRGAGIRVHHALSPMVPMVPRREVILEEVHVRPTHGRAKRPQPVRVRQ